MADDYDPDEDMTDQEVRAAWASGTPVALGAPTANLGRARWSWTCTGGQPHESLTGSTVAWPCPDHPQ